MKNQKYNAGSIQQKNRRKRQNRYPLTHTYMAAHIPCLLEAF